DDLTNGDSMKADGIRPVGGTRREHAGERTATVRTRVNLQRIASSPMEPGQHDDLVPGGETVESLCQRLIHLEPGAGRALGTLFRCLLATLEGRSDHANRVYLSSSHTPHRRPPRDGSCGRT